MDIEVFSNIGNLPKYAAKRIEEEVCKQNIYFNETNDPATPLYWFFDFEFGGYWIECFDYSEEYNVLLVRANPTWFMVREGEL